LTIPFALDERFIFFEFASPVYIEGTLMRSLTATIVSHAPDCRSVSTDYVSPAY
jgi:hypothetical protein